MKKQQLTYDIHFNSYNDSLNKGFKQSKQYCIDYINNNKKVLQQQYPYYYASVVCNETNDCVYEINL